MSVLANLPPVERRVLRHEVLLGLRTGILTGDIAPGTRLLEVPLANELGVSRGPIREALRQLEQEGLVEFFPHRGAVVVGVAEAEVETIYGIRALLEGRAFARACRVVTDDDIDALAETVARMIEASEAGDLARRRPSSTCSSMAGSSSSPGSSTCADCGRTSTGSSVHRRRQPGARRAGRSGDGPRPADRAVDRTPRARRGASQSATGDRVPGGDRPTSTAASTDSAPTTPR